MSRRSGFSERILRRTKCQSQANPREPMVEKVLYHERRLCHL
jgi:hypothetical protein